MSDGKPKPLLSPRQKQIAEYLALGFSAKGIAEIIGLKRSSVNSHILKIKKKLGANNTTHCVVIAIQLGEITILPALDTPLNQRPNGGKEKLHNE